MTRSRTWSKKWEVQASQGWTKQHLEYEKQFSMKFHDHLYQDHMIWQQQSQVLLHSNHWTSLPHTSHHQWAGQCQPWWWGGTVGPTTTSHSTSWCQYSLCSHVSTGTFYFSSNTTHCLHNVLIRKGLLEVDCSCHIKLLDNAWNF